MVRAPKSVSVALGVALLASLVFVASAVGQGADTMKLQLTPSRASGVSGTATITDVGEGARIELNMRGLPKAGIRHINHFHAGGSCADRAGDVAPATIPLMTIVAKGGGTGSGATTLEDVTLDQLFDPDKKRYVAPHSKTEEGQGVPPSSPAPMSSKPPVPVPSAPISPKAAERASRWCCSLPVRS